MVLSGTARRIGLRVALALLVACAACARGRKPTPVPIVKPLSPGNGASSPASPLNVLPAPDEPRAAYRRIAKTSELDGHAVLLNGAATGLLFAGGRLHEVAVNAPHIRPVTLVGLAPLKPWSEVSLLGTWPEHAFWLGSYYDPALSPEVQAGLTDRFRLATYAKSGWSESFVYSDHLFVAGIVAWQFGQYVAVLEPWEAQQNATYEFGWASEGANVPLPKPSGLHAYGLFGNGLGTLVVEGFPTSPDEGPVVERFSPGRLVGVVEKLPASCSKFRGDRSNQDRWVEGGVLSDGSAFVLLKGDAVSASCVAHFDGREWLATAVPGIAWHLGARGSRAWLVTDTGLYFFRNGAWALEALGPKNAGLSVRSAESIGGQMFVLARADGKEPGYYLLTRSSDDPPVIDLQAD